MSRHQFVNIIFACCFGTIHCCTNHGMVEGFYIIKHVAIGALFCMWIIKYSSAYKLHQSAFLQHSQTPAGFRRRICNGRGGRKGRVRQRKRGREGGGEFYPSRILKDSAVPEYVYVRPTISYKNHGHHTYSALLRARYEDIGDNIIECSA